MTDSFQDEVPKARIDLKLDLHRGGVSKKTGLPLTLLLDPALGAELSALAPKS